MARSLLIRTNEFPYHVTSRTNNKEWFQVSMDECWNIFEEELAIVSKKHGAKIGSFVLMSNHFHMILWTPHENLDQIMHSLLWSVSRKLNNKSERINHVFGTRYKWCLMKNNSYLSHVYKYVYLNPVRAGICQNVKDYRYSTLFFLLHKEKCKFRVHDYIFVDFDLVSKDLINRIDWINELYTEKQNKFLKNRMRYSEFTLPTHNNYKSIIKLFNKLPGNLL